MVATWVVSRQIFETQKIEWNSMGTKTRLKRIVGKKYRHKTMYPILWMPLYLFSTKAKKFNYHEITLNLTQYIFLTHFNITLAQSLTMGPGLWDPFGSQGSLTHWVRSRDVYGSGIPWSPGSLASWGLKKWVSYWLCVSIKWFLRINDKRFVHLNYSS